MSAGVIRAGAMSRTLLVCYEVALPGGTQAADAFVVVPDLSIKALNTIRQGITAEMARQGLIPRGQLIFRSITVLEDEPAANGVELPFKRGAGS